MSSKKKFYVLYSLAGQITPRIYKTKATVRKYTKEDSTLSFYEFRNLEEAEQYIDKISKRYQENTLQSSLRHIENLKQATNSFGAPTQDSSVHKPIQSTTEDKGQTIIANEEIITEIMKQKEKEVQGMEIQSQQNTKKDIQELMLESEQTGNALQARQEETITQMVGQNIQMHKKAVVNYKQSEQVEQAASQNKQMVQQPSDKSDLHLQATQQEKNSDSGTEKEEIVSKKEVEDKLKVQEEVETKVEDLVRQKQRVDEDQQITNEVNLEQIQHEQPKQFSEVIDEPSQPIQSTIPQTLQSQSQSKQEIVPISQFQQHKVQPIFQEIQISYKTITEQQLSSLINDVQSVYPWYKPISHPCFVNSPTLKINQIRRQIPGYTYGQYQFMNADQVVQSYKFAMRITRGNQGILQGIVSALTDSLYSTYRLCPQNESNCLKMRLPKNIIERGSNSLDDRLVKAAQLINKLKNNHFCIH